MVSPTDARDRETARRIAGRCWYSNNDTPDATCAAVGAPDHCVQCVETDAIATALADARREERERAITAVRDTFAGELAYLRLNRNAQELLPSVRDKVLAAIRARGEGEG